MVDSTWWTEKIERRKMILPKIKVFFVTKPIYTRPSIPTWFCFGKNQHAAMYTHMLIRLSLEVLPYQPGKRKGLAEIKGNVWPRFMGKK